MTLAYYLAMSGSRGLTTELNISSFRDDSRNRVTAL